MKLVPLALPLGSGQARHGLDGAARLINGYSEEIGEGGKTSVANYCIDGSSRFSTMSGTGGVRAMLALTDDDLHVVAGRQWFRVDQTGASSVVGGVVSDGLVTMARNRASAPQIVTVCDGSVQYYVSGVVTDLSDPDLPPPNSVTAINGYFAFTCFDGRWFISGVDDVTVDGLDFTTAASNPDPLLRGFTRGQDLLLFGSRSMEAWADTGGDPFPFSRTTSIPVGCLSAASVTEVDQTVGWIAHDGTVRLLNGYQATRISTHQLERLIRDDASPSTITGYAWSTSGHTFFGLTGSTWSMVYDLTTGKWHERQSYGLTRWRYQTAVQFGDRRLFGHISNPHLMINDAALHTEDGDVIEWSTQFAPTHAFPNDVVCSAIHLDVLTGTGTGTGAAENIDPQLMLDYSDDGGHNWSTQRLLNVGQQGQRNTKIKSFRLGRIPHTGRTWRIAQSASTARALMSVMMEAG